MIKIISECNDFLKNCGLTYAFCGGYAFELFLNKKIRSHSDVDITVFEKDKNIIINFMLKQGWNVYEPKIDWADNKIVSRNLRPILNSHDENIAQLFFVFAIKPNCSFIRIEPKFGDSSIFEFEILNEKQLNLDFIEIIFNKQQGRNFICDSDKHILRELDKAILYNNGVSYLAPEVILFFISNPAYLKSEYHKEKNQIDFESVAPLLPRESKDWLINSLEIKYPEGNIRLEQLKAF